MQGVNIKCKTMYLKRLEIYGFKTFAESVDLEFGPGITAIVGPNGSGKSNISDAVLWVLGEQGSKAIRTNRSTDVIFNGSDAKRALGLAEVHLTLDNSSGMLPTDFSEVTVSRRVFRSGESEYLINKVPVRLRDVQDLFLDTGIGKQSYSIISQGEVDAVLSSRSEDRRALFEEAAGINKYKHRKRETLRKLEQTRINLLRVNDIVGELENQVEPLNIAADKAREYKSLHQEERKLQLSLDVLQYTNLKQTLERSRERAEAHDKELEEYNSSQSKIEITESVLRVNLQKKDEEIEAARSLLHQREIAVKEAENAIENKVRENENKKAEIKRLEAELTSLVTDKQNFDRQMAETAKQATDAKEELSKLSEMRETHEKKLSEERAKFEKMRNEQAGFRSNEMVIFDKLSRAKNSLAQQDYLLGNVDNQLKKIADETASIEGKLQELAEKSKATKAEADQIAEKLAKSNAELVKSRETKANAQEQRTKKEKIFAELREKIAALRANISTLSNLEQEREGYYPGVKAVFAYKNEGKISGDFWSLSDIIKVDSRFDTAFEVALGANIQDIITDSEKSAKAAINALKENRAGRATFLPLDILRADRIATVPKNAPKIIGVAADLAKFDAKFRDAVIHALGRIIVAEDLDSALALSKSGEAKGWKSIVTLDGEIVTPAQTISGGSRGKGSGLFKRKNDLDAFNNALLTAEDELKKVGAELEKVTVEIKDTDKNIFDLQNTTEEIRYKEMTFKGNLSQYESEEKRLNESNVVLLTDKETILVDHKNAEKLKGELVGEIAEFEKQKEAILRDIKGLSENLSEFEAMLAHENEIANNYKVRAAELTSVVASAEQNERTSATLKQSILNREKENGERLAKLKEEIGGFEEVSSNMSTDLIRFGSAVTQSQKELGDLREERAKILNDISANLEAQKSGRAGADEIKSKIQKAAVRCAQVETEIHLLEQKFSGEWGLLPADAVNTAEPVQNRGVAVLRLTEVKGLIENLGEVNMLAVEEYEKVTERLSFLTREREDLIVGREKLEGIIKEIDVICAEKFMSAFEKIGEHFQDIFSRLFGGGIAKLSLIDVTNILESGIDINVQIPGKRNQNLVQLSGGERALTALSLLFAMLKVKPSPFVILDEIDAPLDEANVGRYGDILKDFTQNTQFLTVTHNKGTMEVADVLYGVTMEKAGISKIVSVKLT